VLLQRADKVKPTLRAELHGKMAVTTGGAQQKVFQNESNEQVVGVEE